MAEDEDGQVYVNGYPIPPGVSGQQVATALDRHCGLNEIECRDSFGCTGAAEADCQRYLAGSDGWNPM